MGEDDALPVLQRQEVDGAGGLLEDGEVVVVRGGYTLALQHAVALFQRLSTGRGSALWLRGTVWLGVCARLRCGGHKRLWWGRGFERQEGGGGGGGE